MCGALCVFLSLNFAAAKWAQAEVSDAIEARGLELGRQLHQAASLMDAFEGERSRGRAGGAHQLLLNGAEVVVHSGSVTLSESTSLESLISKVKSNCRAFRRSESTTGAGTRAENPAIKNAAGSSAAEVPVVHAPLFEWVGEKEAFVYCLKLDRPLSLQGVTELFETFGKTGDLTAWGTFQGAYFRVEESSISVLTAEIKRNLAPARMFPVGIDAPGANIAALPTPPGRRLLSLAHNGISALTLHEAGGEPLELLGAYHERLIAAGLSVERAEIEQAGSSRSQALALVARSEREAFVIAAKAASGASQLVIARLPE